MVPARTAGQKAADLAMKAVATALFTTTVVSGVCVPTKRLGRPFASANRG